jgi:hypothetical protein
MAGVPTWLVWSADDFLLLGAVLVAALAIFSFYVDGRGGGE